MPRLAPAAAAAASAAAAAWAGPAVADPASDAANEIVKQWGAPGAIIVILGTAVLYLGWSLRASWQARLDDQRGFSEKFVALSNDYNVSTHDIAKTIAAQSVALEGIDAGAKARWLEAKGALDRLSDKLDDRLDPLNTGIAANGSSLNGISADIRDMRNHALGQRGGGGR